MPSLPFIDTGRDSLLLDNTTPEQTNNACCTFFWRALDIWRYFISTAITLASCVLVVYAIGEGYAQLPGPPLVLYIIFVSVLVLLAYLEGLQVAILALEHIDPESLRDKYPRAYKTQKLAMARQGLNVQRFLVGRQFFVVFVVFLCAQLTTYPTMPMHGVPEWAFIAVIDTGLPGAFIVLAFGQLMPQLIAASHPKTFMNMYFTREVVLIALGFESVGITHFSWLLASAICQKFLRLDPTVKLLSPRNVPALQSPQMSASGSDVVKELRAEVGHLQETIRELQEKLAGTEGTHREIESL